MLSPVDPVIIVLLGYLLFVLKVGPKFMENRVPFDLRNIIKSYNIFQIIYNVWMLGYAIHFLFVLRLYDLGCMTSLPHDHEHKHRETYFGTLYLVNKFADLTETIFFVLRKKNRQISVLHVFHHVSMPLVVYLFIRLQGFAAVILYCVLNVAVHVLMYTYYYLSSVSQAVQSSLWWKKYITMVQMVQFGIILSIIAYTLSQPNCNVPRPVVYVSGCLTLSFLVLFSNFYVKSYLRSDRKRGQKAQ
ncbi:elongation of very long chain fatty acids protein F [Drosophila ananassae]|nr:elongation of very long chain fatty acids protein F [Drosophila ananassae]